MKVQLGFSRTNSFLSRAIRFFTRAPVSHTFLVVELEGKQFVMEAADAGFRMISLRQFIKENIIVQIIEPVVPLDKGLDEAEEWLGERYGWEGLIGFSWVLLWRMLKRKVRNPFHGAKALFCSEANTMVIQASGWPGSQSLDPSATSPYDLMQFCQANTG